MVIFIYTAMQIFTFQHERGVNLKKHNYNKTAAITLVSLSVVLQQYLSYFSRKKLIYHTLYTDVIAILENGV